MCSRHKPSMLFVVGSQHEHTSIAISSIIRTYPYAPVTSILSKADLIFCCISCNVGLPGDAMRGEMGLFCLRVETNRDPRVQCASIATWELHRFAQSSNCSNPCIPAPCLNPAQIRASTLCVFSSLMPSQTSYNC